MRISVFLPLFLSAVFFIAGCSKKKAPDTRAFLQVQTEPSAAVVYLDGKKSGKGDVSGYVSPGRHFLKIECPGYHTVWHNLNLKPSSRNILKPFSLEPVRTSALIESIPSGAEVFMNGKVIGNTPLVLRNLAIGKYSITLKSPKYSPKEFSWTMDSERPKLLKISLASNVGTLSVKTNPEGARILINGVLQGTSPLRMELEQGPYQVTAEMNGYETHTRDIQIVRERRESIDISLAQKLCTLSVETDPAGADITINGKSCGASPLSLKDLKAGKYEIVIRKKNCEIMKIPVTLEPGTVHPVKVKLDSSTGSLSFVTTPAGISVYLNGEFQFVTEKDPNQPWMSKVHRIDYLQPGTYTLKFQHKRAKKPQVFSNLRVEKRKDTRLPRNVEFWIPNARLTKINGEIVTGRLVVRLKNGDVRFEPCRGITDLIRRNEYSNIEMLEEDEQ